MAKNTGRGSRVGSVTGRTQFKTSSGHSAKRNTSNGQIMAVKTSSKAAFKGVAREKDGRRS
jgi:hypothetical protein